MSQIRNSDYYKIGRGLINGIWSPMDAARLCCTTAIYGPKEARKMDISCFLYEKLAADHSLLDEIAVQVAEIWKKERTE